MKSDEAMIIRIAEVLKPLFGSFGFAVGGSASPDVRTVTRSRDGLEIIPLSNGGSASPDVRTVTFPAAISSRSQAAATAPLSDGKGAGVGRRERRGPSAVVPLERASMNSDEAKKLMPTRYASSFEQGFSLGKKRAPAGAMMMNWIEAFAEGYATSLVEGHIAEQRRLATILMSPAIDLEGSDRWRVALKLASDAPEMSAETIVDIIGTHVAKPASISSRNSQNVAVLLGHGLTDRDDDAWASIAADVSRRRYNVKAEIPLKN
jgi:hypothetical protein